MGLRSLPTLLLQTLSLALRPRVLNIGANLTLTDGPNSGEATLAATGGGGSPGTFDVMVGNTTGSTILKSSIVRFSDNASSGNPLVRLTDNTSPPNNGNPFGIMLADMPDGGTGSCRTIGVVTGLNTSGFSPGDDVFAGAAGAFAPFPTTGAAWCGLVLVSDATVGTVFVGCGLGSLPYVTNHGHTSNQDAGAIQVPHFNELAGTFASPPAGQQIVFVDSADHKLKRMNSSGTVVIIG